MKALRFASPLLAALAMMSAQVQAADNIKVGVLTTLSGPASAPGIDQRDAINLAMKLLGNKLGGLPAELITVDDQFSPDAAKQAADRLLRRDKIDVLTGVIYSNVLLAVVPSAIANKTIVVSSNAGPAAIAGKECSPYFFSASWQNDATHEAAGKYMTDKGYKRVALIAPNYPAGKDSAAGFKRFFKGELVAEMYPKLGQLDFAAEIAQVRAAGVDAIYYFLPGGMGVNFTKQYAAAGMSTKIARVFQAYDADQQMLTIGELIEGVVNTGQWSSDMDNEANKRFVTEFTKAYGRMPSMYASQAWDVVGLLDVAVRNVGGKIEDREAFIAAIQAAKGFKSVRGDFRFGRNQFPIQNQYARVVTKGADGKYQNRMVGQVMKDHGDAYIGECAMK
jgi:branched-chain amino acid transport system substrate-binding protein